MKPKKHIVKILKNLPKTPGVYLMKDIDNEIIYIGKAKVLKNRVRSYFARKHDSIKTEALVRKIHNIEYIETGSELEALILEDILVKKHRPRYNIRLKDDKTFPFIKLYINYKYPYAEITRKLKNDKNLYFGPFMGFKTREMMNNIIHKHFHIRRCKKNLEKRLRRPCLYFHIKQCKGPCIRKISENEYSKVVKDVISFLKGKDKELLKSLKNKMMEYSDNLEFEKAAELRDTIDACKQLFEKQNITKLEFKTTDIIAVNSDEKYVVFFIFFVRDGKISDSINFKFNNIADINDIVINFLKDFYKKDIKNIPKKIYINRSLKSLNVLKDFFKMKYSLNFNVKNPKKGKYHKLLKLAIQNSQSVLTQIQVKEAKDDKGSILKNLKKLVELRSLPKRIEAFDISNIAGTFSVSGMVVFKDGKPAKKEYRKFKIKTVEGIDDFASIAEVVYRRYRRVLDENLEKPNLIIIDGGKGQLSSAYEMLHELDFLKDVDLISIAKKEEIIYKIENDEFVEYKLSKRTHELKLIQEIRDEVHRFSITFHRQRRSTSLTKSILDDIKGVGPKRKKILFEHFDDIAKIKEYKFEELLKIDGIDKKTAESIFNHFHDKT